MIIQSLRPEKTSYFSLLNLYREFQFIGRLFLLDNCPHRYFDEKLRKGTSFNSNGKREAGGRA